MMQIVRKEVSLKVLLMQNFQTAATVLTHRLPHSAKPHARILPQRGIKMGRISMIDPETASPEVKAEIARHTAEGHKITNEKRTLLHNIHAFRAVEEASYALDDDLQRLIGKLDGDLFEYAVSVSNDCLVCTTYFSKLLREEHHLDPNHFVLTHRQELLMNFGKKVGHTPKEITDEEFEELKQDFLQHGGRDGEPVDEEKAEEIMVVLTAMGAMMVANNYVNDVLKVDV